MDKKMPSRPSSFLFSFATEWNPRANQTPHQPQEEDEENSLMAGPHHMVLSFHSWECSSMSLSMCFLLQYLTTMKTPSRSRMMPQAPPTAAARMLISDRETRKKESPNSELNDSCVLTLTNTNRINNKGVLQETQKLQKRGKKRKKELSKFSQTFCLTFADDSEHDLAATAVHIRGVAHLADVSAIKGWRHIIQSDGGVPFQNIT